MALVDIYNLLKDKDNKNYIIILLKEAIDQILKYQDNETKMFYQFVDLGGIEGNYLETSGSAMIAYALMKGARLSMLDKEYWSIGEDILCGIADKYLLDKDSGLVLEGICASAGLGPGPDNRKDRDGTVRYYLSEAKITDNQHGTASCMMAYSEYLMKAKVFD